MEGRLLCLERDVTNLTTWKLLNMSARLGVPISDAQMALTPMPLIQIEPQLDYAESSRRNGLMTYLTKLMLKENDKAIPNCSVSSEWYECLNTYTEILI